MREEGFDIRNLYFPRKGAHTSGICFAFLSATATSDEVEKVIKKFNGLKLDDETSLLAMKSPRPDSVYLALKVDFATSKVSNEDKLSEVSQTAVSLLFYFYWHRNLTFPSPPLPSDATGLQQVRKGGPYLTSPH